MHNPFTPRRSFTWAARKVNGHEYERALLSFAYLLVAVALTLWYLTCVPAILWFVRRRRGVPTTSSVSVPVSGDDRYVAVVGESHYQRDILKLMRAHGTKGLTAVIAPDPRNAYDKHALVVKVEGRTVGYIARDDSYAPTLRMAIARNKKWRSGIPCTARIMPPRDHQAAVLLTVDRYEIWQYTNGI